MNPARKGPDLETYSGRVGQHLYDLRGDVPVSEVVERISRFNKSERKAPSLFAYYKWEDGTNSPHFDLLPAIAKAFKKKTIHEVLPPK